MRTLDPDLSTSRRRRRGALAPEREAEAAARAWSEADFQQAAYRAGILVVALAAAALPLAALLR
jgi:hypothetical protein